MKVKKEGEGLCLTCHGVEKGTQGQMIPASIVRQARAVEFGRGGERKVLTPENGMRMVTKRKGGEEFAVSLDFFGHYHEASFAFQVPAKEMTCLISLWFDPKIENEWHFSLDSNEMAHLSPAQFEEKWGK